MSGTAIRYLKWDAERLSYRYRRIKAARLRPHLPPPHTGGTEFLKYFGKDSKKAELDAAKYHKEVEEALAKARLTLVEAQALSPSFAPRRPEPLDRHASIAAIARWEADETIRQLDQAWSNPEQAPSREHDFDAWLSWSAKRAEFRTDLKCGGGWERIPEFDQKLIAALRSAGVPATAHSLELLWLRPLFQEAWHRVIQRVDGREFFDSQIDTSQVVPAPAHGAAPMRPSVILTDVMEKYLAERQMVPDTIEDVRRIVRRLRESLGGDKTVRDITKPEMIALKDRLFKFPARLKRHHREMTLTEIIADVEGDDVEKLSANAVRKWFDLLGAMFNWAVAHDYCDTNPINGIKPERRESQRGSYDGDDLRAIFGSPHFAKLKGADKWLPTLALYHGPRLDEMGQMLLADVKSDNGIGYLHITTLGDKKKRLKNEGSKRKLPLHRKVIDAGLLDYVADLRNKGETYLFPDLPHDGKYKPTHAWSKWWGRFTREKIGIIDPNKVFHSFRHSFKDACREAEIPRDVHDALTGHVDGTASGGYGSGYSLAALDKALQRIRYPSLG